MVSNVQISIYILLLSIFNILGSPYIAIGASGGPTIFPAVFQTLINIIDYGLDPSEAIEFGRLHNQLKPEGTFADETYRADILEALSRQRHRIQGYYVVLNSILS